MKNKNKMEKAREILITAVVFCIMAVLTVLLVTGYMREEKNRAIEKARYLLEAQISELDKALSSYMQATDTLRILIVDSRGRINDFDRVAKEIYNNDPAFRSIQLAPDGNVQYVYPLEGNEEAFGDLFSDSDRKTEAEYARDTGETTLAGPFELYQSGMGIVVRQPIYLEENGEKQFWGFSIVVLNVPEIFNSVHFNTMESLGYNIQLWRMHPDTGEKQIILGSPDSCMKHTIEKSFEVPGSTWTLSLCKKEGWVETEKVIIIGIVAGCITVMISGLCFALLVINRQRKNMMEISYHDYLTELYNGRKMSDVLNAMYSKGRNFYFIYLDINKFKQVNDTYGHAVGDRLLKAVADRILHVIRPGDYAFRIGGDEFAILLPGDIDIDAFVSLLEAEISKELVWENGIVYCPKVSVGYVNFPKDAASIEEIVSSADQKMYRMKHKS